MENITHERLLERFRELEIEYVRAERACDEIAGRIAEVKMMLSWISNPETHPLNSVVGKLEQAVEDNLKIL